MTLTPREKAKELVKKFEDHVNPYIGSGMLSNTYDDGAILYQSKKCALICVEELISQMSGIDSYYSMGVGYWQQVKQEIEKL